MIAFAIVFGTGLVAVVAAYVYFPRHELERPPFGVMNTWDLIFMGATILASPYLYLLVPTIVPAFAMCVMAGSALYLGLTPILRARLLVFSAIGLALGADIATLATAGAGSTAFLVVNDIVLVIVAVCIANVLAQSGLRARQLAGFVAALVVYDYVVTAELGQMQELFVALSTIPLSPFVAWQSGTGFLGMGLGDLILLAATPLLLRKAFGNRAGLLAATTGVITAGMILGALELRLLTVAVPVMTVYGPLVLAQYAVWSRRAGRESTTAEFRASLLATTSSSFTAPLRVATPDGFERR